MADKVTITTELNIVLSNATGTATRVLKIPSPLEPGNLTFDSIKRALLPAFGSSTVFPEQEVIGDIAFFYDDGNQGGYNEPMVRVEYAEWVQTTKTARRYDEEQNTQTD